MEREKLICNIGERIQLALVMAIFFPSLMDSFLGSVESGTTQLNESVLTWSSLAAIYLLSYVIFQGLRRTDISSPLLGILNKSLLIGISFFIFPILFLGTTDATTPISSLPWYSVALFKISMYGLPISAFISLCMIAWSFFWEKGKAIPH